MDYINNIKPYKDVEKNQLINYLKNELKILRGEYQSIDNIDLLIYLMNFVEMYYNKRGSGKIKEEVVRSVLEKCSNSFLDQMIPFVVEKKLLKLRNLN